MSYPSPCSVRKNLKWFSGFWSCRWAFSSMKARHCLSQDAWLSWHLSFLQVAHLNSAHVALHSEVRWSLAQLEHISCDWKHPCDLSCGHAFLWTVPSQHIYLLNLFSYAIVNMIHKASLASPLHASSQAHQHDPADQLLQLPLKTASNQCHKPNC